MFLKSVTTYAIAYSTGSLLLDPLSTLRLNVCVEKTNGDCNQGGEPFAIRGFSMHSCLTDPFNARDTAISGRGNNRVVVIMRRQCAAQARASCSKKLNRVNF